MSSPVDTEDWTLGAWMDWKPAKETVPCDSCHGSGSVGGGFKDMEGPRTCDTCYGRGIKVFYPSTPKPKVPPELVEHMHKAWKSFWEVDSLLPPENK